jgi:transposase InsO family protein
VDYQPRPGIHSKKKRRDRLIRLAEQHPEWVLGFGDEVWWSRLALPAVRTWQASDTPLRLVEQETPKEDADPKALACYGLLARIRTSTSETPVDKILLRFVDGRPVSTVSIDFLSWCSERLHTAGKKALLLVWDNASWHISKAVRSWLGEHNRQVKAGKRVGVRIVLCLLPSKSPWLNAIEQKWVHGKRAVVEPARLLTAKELADRACAYFDCEHEPHLVQPKKAA